MNNVKMIAKRVGFSKKRVFFLALVCIGLSVLVYSVPVFVMEILAIYPLEQVELSIIGNTIDVALVISYTPYYLCVLLGFVFSAVLLLLAYEITWWGYP